MKAVGFWQPGESTSVIEDLSLPHPSMPKGRDLLIRVRAVAVNPRDLKSRRNISPSAGNPVVMGYDASGVVEATGPDVTLFRPVTTFSMPVCSIAVEPTQSFSWLTNALRG